MDGALIIVRQVVILFGLIAIGYAAVRTKLLGKRGVDDVTSILLYIVMPLVVLNLFSRPVEREHLGALLTAFLSGGVCHVLAALTARLVFGRRPAEIRDVLSNAVVFSNSAFMAIPLVQALVGSEGTLYLAPYLVWFNVAAWTYGVRTMNRADSSLNVGKILLNPTILAVAAGLIMVAFDFVLPRPVSDIVAMMADTNAPVAMMLIGAQIALTKPRLLPSKDVLLAALLRNVAVPLLMMCLLLVVTRERTLFFSMLIPTAAPTAATVVLFASRFGRDVRLASESMTFSTFASLISLPLLTLLADTLLRRLT